MKRVTLLAWINTIRLYIKHRGNFEKVQRDTDRELTDAVSDIALKTAYTAKEKDN